MADSDFMPAWARNQSWEHQRLKMRLKSMEEGNAFMREYESRREERLAYYRAYDDGPSA
jgi:hypothetical protein